MNFARVNKDTWQLLSTAIVKLLSSWPDMFEQIRLTHTTHRSGLIRDFPFLLSHIYILDALDTCRFVCVCVCVVLLFLHPW